MLLLMVFGIIEFGRAYFVQATISQAAREGVRTLVVGGTATEARTAVRSAANGIVLTDAQIAVAPSSCATAAVGAAAAVTITYPVSYLTGFFGDGTVLTGRGVMRCES